ncbi:MAG: DUF4432 family protein [Planctomycetota bacterium]|nr:DUF4432 family protein [Planctomycetota bacterium]
MTATLRVPGYHGPRVLTGYTLHGYEAVILENERVRAVVNAGRGTHIPELVYKPRDLDVIFKHPRPHKHHAGFVPTAYDERPYNDHHAGGWFECFPNGGGPGDLEGARIGFHGEVWGQPFRIDAIEESPERCAVTLTGFTQRTPFRLTKTFSLRAGDPCLRIDEKATNLGEQDLKVLWGQHPTFGGPFVDAHCRVEGPATSYFLDGEDPPLRRKWPAQNEQGRDLGQVHGKDARMSRLVYLTDFAEGKVRLVSPTWKLAFEVEFDAARFPYVWFFENAGVLGAPWYGRAQMVALEPFTGMAGSLKEGHGLLKIPAGQTVEASFAGRFVEL